MPPALLRAQLTKMINGTTRIFQSFCFDGLDKLCLFRLFYVNNKGDFMIIIRILLAVLALLLLTIGYYLFSHRGKNFMIFKPETNPALSITLLIFGVIIGVEGLIGLISIIVFIPIFYSIFVALSCLTVGALTIVLSFFMH